MENITIQIDVTSGGKCAKTYENVSSYMISGDHLIITVKDTEHDVDGKYWVVAKNHVYNLGGITNYVVKNETKKYDEKQEL